MYISYQHFLNPQPCLPQPWVGGGKLQVGSSRVMQSSFSFTRPRHKAGRGSQLGLAKSTFTWAGDETRDTRIISNRVVTIAREIHH